MGSLADNIKPPFYAAIIETKPHSSVEEPADTADMLVTTALRRPGFLGLETARNVDGTPITVSYWRELSDVEGWRSESCVKDTPTFPLEIRRVANSNEREAAISYVSSAFDGEMARK